jgi:hypothetical protein
MKKIIGSALAAGLLMASPAPASAGELKLTLTNGRATVIAQNVPLSQILAEWARVGKTTIVNGDKLVGPPITLMLENVPEREALDVLLRSASGYIVAARQDLLADGSAFDRILIMPTSRAPAATAVNNSAPPRFPSRPTPQPMVEPDVDEVDEDPPVGPVMGPTGNTPQTNMPQARPGMPPPLPGSPRQPTNPDDYGDAPASTVPGTATRPGIPAGTAPRPGMPTAVPPGQPSPYPLPPGGVRPPGGGGGA